METYELIHRHTEITIMDSDLVEILAPTARRLIKEGNTDYVVRYSVCGKEVETAELTDYFNG